MGKNFIPTRESVLVTWTKSFEQTIAKQPTDFGLTVEQATAYTTAQAAFAAAYQTANEPMTRSPGNIEIKNTAKDALIALTRELVKIIQAYPGTTNDMRRELGVTVPDLDPTPVPPPSETPTIDVLSVDGWTLNVRLHNGESSRRGKPVGVKGATVFSYVGDQPPMSVDDWKFEGNTTKTDTKVVFPTTVAPGTKVWLTAFWFNPTAQSGPAATPVSRYINYDGMSQAA
ncbi:MAG: hypothetical protein AAGA29_10520 [Planctomycetota bacterium]